MAVTAKMYSNFPLKALKALISDLNAASKVKVMLCTSSYTPNQETHIIKDDVSNEVAGTGYTAGGAFITSPTVTEGSRVTTFDGDDVQWEGSTLTARHAVLYDAVAVDNPLIMWVDFGENKSSDGGTFRIKWNASGIFRITVAA